ncbi:MAG: hypothetical protein IPM91_10275 [Bacteroidetes bacterium]|nr:hypothetical protein [Bacteroidota bacterium]
MLDQSPVVKSYISYFALEAKMALVPTCCGTRLKAGADKESSVHCALAENVAANTVINNMNNFS